MNQKHSLKRIDLGRGSNLGLALVPIVFAASALIAGLGMADAAAAESAGAPVVLAVATNVADFGTPPAAGTTAPAADDCRRRRLATNVQDFGSPFAASLGGAQAVDRPETRSNPNPEDFGAPGPGG